MSTEKGTEARLTARQLAERVRNWMATPEGMRCIQKAGERAVEETKDLERARFISPTEL
jgi:hypothetical protein